MALAVVAAVTVSIVGFALLGETLVAPAPASSPEAALVAPSPTPRWSHTASPRAALATPTPGPTCIPPHVAALDGPIPRRPRPLVPTGFEVMTPWVGAEGNLIADASTGFWAAGSGRLVRLDAKGAITASWTVADDPVFAAWGIVPARQGGVWLWDGSTIAWFDGERFRDVIAAPSQGSGASWVVDVAEAPDGSLWAAVNGEDPAISGGSVVHWDGASWTDACRPWPSVEIAHLAVDDAGGVWVAPTLANQDISLFDGTTWSTPPSEPGWVEDRALPNAWSAGLVAADDGCLWVAQGALGHFDGTTWTGWETHAVDLAMTVSLAAAPDGSAWLATGSVSLPGDTWGPHTGIAIAHFDGHTWTIYDDEDGLPGPRPSSGSTNTAVAASRDAVIAATRDGFYRLSGDRWVRVGRSPAAAPAWAQRLLAVSTSEAWAAADDGLWRVVDGAWTKVPVADWTSPFRAFDVARAPDGTVAVATDQGAAVLRDGRWTVLGSVEAHVVTIADDGAIWIGERESEGTKTTVASFRFDGRDWLRTDLPAVTTIGWPAALVEAPDGERWLLSLGWGTEVHRFDGAQWIRGFDLAGTQLGDGRGLALAPNGDLLVLAPRQDQSDWLIARYDGATWTIDRASDGLAESTNVMGIGGIAIAPDGSSWVATDRGLAHFDGQRWSLHFAGQFFSALSFAPDGTIWVVGPSGVQLLAAELLVEPDPAAR